MKAVGDYIKGGGKVFKDAATAEFYPGEVFELKSAPTASEWDISKYSPSRDGIFVAVQRNYEIVANSLEGMRAYSSRSAA